MPHDSRTGTGRRGPIPTYAKETDRINRERRVSSASDRKELADVDEKAATMIAVIEDGG